MQDQEIKAFIALVDKMRASQKKYFRYRIEKDKNDAIHYENEVDKILEQELRPKGKQQNLFQ